MKKESIEELEKILAEKVEKEEEWRELEIGKVKSVYIGKTKPKHIYTVNLGELGEVPGSPYAYWAPQSLRELFQKYPSLDRDIAGQKDKPKIADVKKGMDTGDDSRFTRFWWEVDINNIASSSVETKYKKWMPFAKGGRPYYFDFIFVINWFNNGAEVKNYENANIRNEEFYFREGLVWVNKMSWTDITKLEPLKICKLPKNTIFASGYNAIFQDNIWSLLAWGRSILNMLLITLLDPNIQNVNVGLIAKLPLPFEIIESEYLPSLAEEAYYLLREWDTGNEPSTQFIMPWLLQVWCGFSHDWKPVTNHPLARDFKWSEFESAREIRGEGKSWNKGASLIALAKECVGSELKLRKRLEDIQNAIDEEVYQIYDVSEEDRRLIEEEISAIEPEEEEKGDEINEIENESAQYEVMPAEEHIKRVLSYFALKVMKEDEDGIVPVGDMFLGTRKEPGMSSRVITKLIQEFGEENLDRIENELAKILSMNIEEWFEEEFFDYHTTLYRLRPVIWQISSEGLRQGKGKGSVKPAFNCFIYWHKLTEDTIPKVRQLYFKPVLEAARREVENVKVKLSKVEGKEKRELEREFEVVSTKYEELRALDETFEKLLKQHELKVTSKSDRVKEKVKEITGKGYKPEQDYGVRVNIEPLKQAGIMPKTAERVKG